MNKLFRHYSTPKFRRKMRELTVESVGTGASMEEMNRWKYVSLRARLEGSVSEESVTIQMDRDTALRVVAQLSEYLNDDKVGVR